ncbi:hypothetical protein M407DRAFT_8674 [Tulasnella calospora MUT 4182]|uniref:Uncharacterized protein n=1 Tax=Tulasnella calospora MUT 4182 TaxID=1051891 RepID=A0A0C3KTY3_9AGAM|nr:hypothetical protein M407DRAFT_8674 [Tulasnella calospora MUT 4182]
MDFNHDGAWDYQDQLGPAIHCPQIIKNIVVDEYRVEWLNMSDPDEDFYSKNHMAGGLAFTHPQVIGGVEYQGARISMETGLIKKVVTVPGHDTWETGKHYNPGTFTVTLLKYSSVTQRAVHHRTYQLRQGTTIGHLIDKIIARQMHHFLFLPYTREGRWKGCGDHLLHTWAVFVRDGDITSANADEDDAMPLADELVYTYITGGAKTYEEVGRGWWVSHNPVQDALTPETAFTNRRLTHQLPPSPEVAAAGVDEEEEHVDEEDATDED